MLHNLVSRLRRVLYAQRWRLLTLFVVVLLPLLAFGVLAMDVWEQDRLAWDEPILLLVHSYDTPTLDVLMIWIARLGYAWGVLPANIVLLLALVAARRRGDAIFYALAVGGAGLLNQAAKLLFQRVRPALWASPAPEKTFSFPSGHAMGSMALVAALVVLTWPTRWRWPMLVLGTPFVLLVGVSRLYLGVHWPSDVLAGWSASLAWVMGLSMLLYGRLTKPTERASPAESPAEIASH